MAKKIECEPMKALACWAVVDSAGFVATLHPFNRLACIGDFVDPLTSESKEWRSAEWKRCRELYGYRCVKVRVTAVE